ncbi:hypothetical protein GGX14DRAFT_695970 [Mycena pura]|uniref:DUF2786 domain-containing protein n=1 Tax=Mycena pura TaxID=153505 RepID=A0AAD6VN96_9AGAR|nr:hypothetical protein GGX14DRAFT_695970 [Mycena pura]
MSRRRFDSDSDCDTDSTDDYTPVKKKPRSSARNAQTPKTKAHVSVRATDTPLDRTDAKQRVDGIDQAVIGRIKKALALATHSGTSEDEARAALRMASKLLERHNVTQAEIMAQESETEQLKRHCWTIVVDSSLPFAILIPFPRTVSIRSTVAADKPVNAQTWVGTLARAIEIYFDCQSYSTRFGDAPQPRIDHTFYGLAEQTVAAVHAFEMVYNLIVAWCLRPAIGKGVNARKCVLPEGSLLSHLTSHFQVVIAKVLHMSMANKEKELDKQRAVNKEQALLKAQQEQEAADDKTRLDRLKGPEEIQVKEEERDVDIKPEQRRKVKIEQVDDNDDALFGGHRPHDSVSPTDDDDDNDTYAELDFESAGVDFDDADNIEDLLDLDAEKPTLKKKRSASPALPGSMGPPPEPTVKPEPEEDSPWSSVGQLIAFRESSIALGDEYLKKEGIKLYKGRKVQPLQFKEPNSRELYNRGKKDAEKIDVRQKQLKDADMD